MEDFASAADIAIKQTQTVLQSLEAFKSNLQDDDEHKTKRVKTSSDSITQSTAIGTSSVDGKFVYTIIPYMT
jgi:porphobilinogen deaminase